MGPALIVFAAVLWALDGVVRRSLFALPPSSIVFYEHLIGAIILAPIILPLFKKEKITRRSIGLSVLIAALSGVLGTLWFTTALFKVNFISFSVVFLLQKLQPIFATSSAVILLKEKVTTNYLKWAGLAFVAAFFVTFKNGVVNLDTGPGTVQAALLAVGAAFAWGTSTSFSKMLLKEHSYQMATGLRFIFTAVLAFFVMNFLGQSVAPLELTGSQLGRFVFIAISTGMVALLIYYKGLQKTEAKISTILELVFPVLAVMIDAIVYKSFLTPTQVLAAGVLLYAVYKTSELQVRKTAKKQPKK